MSFEDLPEGWTVWHDEPGGKSVLVYRPDVFDSQAYPAPCLPTLYVARGGRGRRPGSARQGADEWRVTLFLEPEVEAAADRYDDRAAAVAGAVDCARRFARGEVDYRDRYQVPREAYLDRLDELTGRAPEPSDA